MRLLSRFSGGPRHAGRAPLGGFAARLLAVLAALAALASLAVLATSLFARASRSSIARFLLMFPAYLLALLGTCSNDFRYALRISRRFSTGWGVDRNAPFSNRPARPRSGRARAETIVRACCLYSLAALASLALLLFVVLALVLSLFLLLLLLLQRLQCAMLSSLTRFPFHDSLGFGGPRPQKQLRG